MKKMIISVWTFFLLMNTLLGQGKDSGCVINNEFRVAQIAKAYNNDNFVSDNPEKTSEEGDSSYVTNDGKKSYVFARNDFGNIAFQRPDRDPLYKAYDGKGLVGIYHRKGDLSYPKGMIMLKDLEQEWDENIDYKKNAKAIWRGSIKAPYTGTVSLKLSATVTTTTLKIKVKDEVYNLSPLGSSWVDIEMRKGEKYPVEIDFFNVNNGSTKGAFKVEWSWNDQDYELVKEKYLSYSSKDLDDFAWMIELDQSTFTSDTHLKAINARHSTLYYEQGVFAAWPANGGIWNWGDEILVSFSRAYYQDKPHQHSYDKTRGFPNGRTFFRSYDKGETWKQTDISLSYDDAKQIGDINRPLHFEDPRFAFVGNGKTMNFSFDKGKTWNMPYEYPDFGKDIGGHSSRTDYVVLNDSTIRIFTALKFIGEKGYGIDRSCMLETTDNFGTLKFISWIAETDTLRSTMSSTIKITDNHMLTALRRKYATPVSVNNGLDFNWIDVYETKDGGRTWHFLSKIADTDKGRRNGNPPAMVYLNDGTICVAYGFRGVPYAILARTSNDEGQTWSKEIVIREDGTKWDMGYVRMVPREDNKVLMVYYFSTEEMPEPHIEFTIWNPKEVNLY